MVVLALLAVSLLLVLWALRGRHTEHGDLVVALTLPVVMMAALLNSSELWATVRFGHVVAIPLAIACSRHPRTREGRVPAWSALLLAVLCFLSHLVFFRTAMAAGAWEPRDRATSARHQDTCGEDGGMVGT